MPPRDRDSITDIIENKVSPIRLENHKDDFVGNIVSFSPLHGFNPSTGGTTPTDSNKAKEWINIFGEKYTAHNCYGAGDPKCNIYWQNDPNKRPIPYVLGTKMPVYVAPRSNKP